jgi:hypothetical protein
VLKTRELMSLTGLAKKLRMPSSSWMVSRSLDHIVRLIEPKATRRGRCSAGGWLDPLSSLQLSQRNQADTSLDLILMCISWYVKLDLTLKPSTPT